MRDMFPPPFWMVLGPKGAPTVRHPYEEAAKKEAERLAVRQPDDVFYVLKAEYRVSAIKPVECVKLEHPF